jgi:hypothetical protein
MSLTVWNTPARHKGDLRDVIRLIRGARQGMLFLVNARRDLDILMKEIFGLLRDKDLFIEGLSWSNGGSRRGRTLYEHYLNGQRLLLSQPFPDSPIDSTIVLVDPFGPHPVVMTGSHDLSLKSSEKNDSDLLVIENDSGLAAGYAVHLIGLFDHYRFRHFVATQRGKSFIGLRPTDAWQERYFKGDKRSEFNFLFGTLSPGL